VKCVTNKERKHNCIIVFNDIASILATIAITMKSFIKKTILTGLTALALLGTAVQGYSQVTLLVDSTQNWIGYMNFFYMPATPGYGNLGGYAGGQVWGTADLRAFFDATKTNTLTLTPNTNVWNPADNFWTTNNGTLPNTLPNKIMDANMYVQNDALAGQSLTFTGVCVSTTLVFPYTNTVFIKDLNSGYAIVQQAVAQLIPGQPFSISLTPNVGDHVQYGFETVGPDANPSTLASLGQVVVQVQIPALRIAALANQVLVEGQTATFTAVPGGNAPFHYQWAYIDNTTTPPTTNNLSNGGRISGATTNALNISNILATDAGTYQVTVTNANGLVASTASLVVLPLAQARTNLLIDPSFELGLIDNNGGTAGWDYYNGSVIQNNTDYYYLTANLVNVLDGTNCVQVYNYGSYNGIYQDRPATPGAIYMANAWMYTPSLDQVAGGNCYLEVQFRDAGKNLLQDYQSANQVTTATPADTWINFSMTNAYVYSSTFVPLGTAPYLLAPAGTAWVRTQITYANPVGGSVYVDNLDLMLKSPVAKAAASGSNIQISFPTLFGPTYQVLYKTNLTDASWTLLTSVVGDGTVKSVSDPATSKTRFYTVQTH